MSSTWWLLNRYAQAVARETCICSTSRVGMITLTLTGSSIFFGVLAMYHICHLLIEAEEDYSMHARRSAGPIWQVSNKAMMLHGTNRRRQAILVHEVPHNTTGPCYSSSHGGCAAVA
jgi:hypothetical protein